MLTKKGIGLAPLIIEFTLWVDANLRKFNEIDIIDGLKADKSMIIDAVQNNYNSMLVQFG